MSIGHEAVADVGSSPGEREPGRRRKRTVLSRRARGAEERLDAKVRVIVLRAKRAGTLGSGSPWRSLDPTNDEAWARGRGG
jgi:hypothetical protein